jgi:hypothetical protein
MSMRNLGGGKTLGGSKSRQKVTILHETITPNQYLGKVQAHFNPSELRYSREVAWTIDPTSGQTIIATSPRIEFQSSRPQTLAIDLFFDTYEGVPGGPAPAPGTSPATDVSRYTGQVASLATLWRELHRPPRCQLWWGQYLLIRGVLTSISENYNFFLADGTPVRAVLSCTFTEAIDPDDRVTAPEQHSSDVDKRRIVRRGDTLSSIALQEYNDASKWRHIAEANKLDDPRQLRPGQSLLIPSLRIG